MTRITTVISVFALAVGLSGWCGCDSEEPTYDVTVKWNISGFPTCQASLGQDELITFENIVVETINNETQEVDKSPEIPCTDFQYTIPNLEEGNYTVKLYAYAHYQEQYLAFFQGQGAITAPASAGVEYNITLVIGKATIQVVWGFDFGTCGGNGVDGISVMLEGDVQDVPPRDTTCDSPDGMIIEDIPWGTYTIFVKGYAGAQQTHEGEYGPVELLPHVYETPFQIKLEPLE